MSSTPVIYHNPRCSKSRASLAILEQHDAEPEIVEYLKTPPTEKQLSSLLTLLNFTPRELIRTGQSEYKDLNLANPDLSDQELIKTMVAHPIMIERPIIVHNGKAVIGRPPENVLDIL